MILYYTGATASISEQPNPFQSLGGFVSNSRVPNGVKNSIFSTITRNQLRSQYSQIRMIALQNQSPSTVTLVNVYTEKPNGSLFDYKIAAIAPALDTVSNKYYFEQLNSENELPFQSTLAAHETSGAALAIGSMLTLAYVGIWVQRIPNLTAVNTLLGDLSSNNQTITDEQIAYLEEQANLEESFSLKVNYT